MARKGLTNADWAQLAPFFPRKGPQAKRRLRLEGIPGRKNRTVPVAYDKHWYKSRHLVENFFCRIADHRRVATRDEKTARRFLATDNDVADFSPSRTVILVKRRCLTISPAFSATSESCGTNAREARSRSTIRCSR